MDSQLHGASFFTILLQEGEESYNDYLIASLNDNLESQVSPSKPKQENIKKIKSRQGNLSVEDNYLLILASFSTRLDLIYEVDQSKHSFLARVHEHHVETKKSTSCEHCPISLMNR